jgi:hypothetical protein
MDKIKYIPPEYNERFGDLEDDIGSLVFPQSLSHEQKEALAESLIEFNKKICNEIESVYNRKDRLIINKLNELGYDLDINNMDQLKEFAETRCRVFRATHNNTVTLMIDQIGVLSWVEDNMSRIIKDKIITIKK